MPGVANISSRPPVEGARSPQEKPSGWRTHTKSWHAYPSGHQLRWQSHMLVPAQDETWSNLHPVKSFPFFQIFCSTLLHSGLADRAGWKEEEWGKRGCVGPQWAGGAPTPQVLFQPFSSEWHFYVKKNWGESRWIKSVKIIVLLAQTRAVVQVCTKPK